MKFVAQPGTTSQATNAAGGAAASTRPATSNRLSRRDRLFSQPPGPSMHGRLRHVQGSHADWLRLWFRFGRMRRAESSQVVGGGGSVARRQRPDIITLAFDAQNGFSIVTAPATFLVPNWRSEWKDGFTSQFLPCSLKTQIVRSRLTSGRRRFAAENSSASAANHRSDRIDARRTPIRPEHRRADAWARESFHRRPAGAGVACLALCTRPSGGALNQRADVRRSGGAWGIKSSSRSWISTPASFTQS